jgi:hypothetical protein
MNWCDAAFHFQIALGIEHDARAMLVARRLAGCHAV